MPLFSRNPRPKSLADLPRRWDAIQTPIREEHAHGPQGLLTAFIIFLCLLLMAGAVAFWKIGTFGPTNADAEVKPPAHEALSAILDSARLLMRQSQWARAEAVLRPATMKFPEDQETRVALAETLVAQNKFADAYGQYEKALAIGPRESKMEYAAGMAASSAGLTERAEEHFSMAQTAQPNNASYALMLGTVQRKLNHIEAAKASLLRVVNLDPEKVVAWGTLADIALGENNLNLALQHIERARRLEPQNRDWRLIEARALKRKAEPEKALMVLLPMDPSQRHEGPVVRLIAECYGMLGRGPDAAAAMAEAFTADPTDKDLAYDTAVAFERIGNKSKALDYAKQAKILGHEGAPKLIERLMQP
jgi:predicted Zn-dependent protease